ncbi:MAG TPA: RidA family protein [Bryobacteraceae bacterium]|jgi:reactive intermediate/imine deaminase|nr:RidA family protein [Bryobacteraceae bacterium]
MLRTPLLIALVLVAGLPAAEKRRVIAPPELAPAPGAPALISPGILIDGTLYVSGTVGTDIKTNRLPADFEAEVNAALDRIGYVLKAAGMTFDDVVSVQVYLTDMSLFQRMNAVYGSRFKAPRPARTTVGVTKLALEGAHIEITVTARK